MTTYPLIYTKLARPVAHGCRTALNAAQHKRASFLTTAGKDARTLFIKLLSCQCACGPMQFFFVLWPQEAARLGTPAPEPYGPIALKYP